MMLRHPLWRRRLVPQLLSDDAQPGMPSERTLAGTSGSDVLEGYMDVAGAAAHDHGAAPEPGSLCVREAVLCSEGCTSDSDGVQASAALSLELAASTVGLAASGSVTCELEQFSERRISVLEELD